MDCVITQSVDMLHQEAEVLQDRVFQLHGSMQCSVCLNCHKPFPMKETLQWIRNRIQTPDCPNGHGITKPDAVFFGFTIASNNVTEVTGRSQNCDLIIAIGSTLVVWPAPYMAAYAQSAVAKLALINLSPTALDR